MNKTSLKNLKPFKKGNKQGQGRPKGSLNRKTLFDRWNFVVKKKNPLTNKIEGLSQDDLVILSLLDKAKKGDVNAIKEWLDSRFGKVKDIVEIEAEKENDKIQALLDEINERRFSGK